ncbi:cartilage oligomeric matrix protein-like [Sabethes cyaneus]|uniref:cartilage oligomeric matrix protein-like n=1 Tax=Sabethes cyaneus TaxID=53552 RepID=UPI00237ED6D7|nr:cartilage oligomeric matrix protein-like [Sabethes cyaneus]
MASHYSFAFVLLLSMVATIWTRSSPPSTAVGCYGDARDYYFQQSMLLADMLPRNSPFAPDKCRLAYDMLKQIENLRVVMDKCDRCQAEIVEIPSRGGICGGGLCFEGSSCTDNYRPSTAVCGPCPVGFDGNGTHCIRRNLAKSYSATRCHNA